MNQPLPKPGKFLLLLLSSVLSAPSTVIDGQSGSRTEGTTDSRLWKTSQRPARSQGTLVLPSPRLSPAIYGPTDLQTCRQTVGGRGDRVLGGRSSTRDRSVLILNPFFPRRLCTSHSLPSPAARSPPIPSMKMGMRRGTAVFRK